MSQIIQSAEVDVPVQTAYNQWTQFEQFPLFMEGVEEVRQVDNRRLQWRAKVGGKTVAWDAEIVEQVPDSRIAWRSTSGAQHNGIVTFDRVGADRTRVTLHLSVDPETLTEKVGDALGVVSARVKGDLHRFKDFIEKRRVETGAWRGEIRGTEFESPTA